MQQSETVLILGGAGLVGLQTARRLAQDTPAKKMIIASLFRREAEDAVADLKVDFPGIEWVPAWGDIFLPEDAGGDGENSVSRSEMIRSPEFRRRVFDAVFGDFEAAYRSSRLAKLLLQFRPDVVVDSVNTATGLSYQDVFSTASVVQRWVDEVRAGANTAEPAFLQEVETLAISQMVPQLVRHVRLLHRALQEVGSRIYIKVGTTGTGGMGLNIPFTHGEDKPSAVLMSKTSIGFAHTGLLFLMARTPGSPIIKEIKPAAMIGYKDVAVHTVRDKAYERVGEGTSRRVVIKDRAAVTLWEGKLETLGTSLDTEPSPDLYEPQRDGEGNPQSLKMVCVNTGENGLFTKGEFVAITSLDQMEYVTPEEIAHLISLEVRGHNTGRDVVQAMDSAVLDPSYRAGIIRNIAIGELNRQEALDGHPSVAIGQLGPPQLAKYLYEAHLFKMVYGTVARALTRDDGRPRTPEDLSVALHSRLMSDPIRDTLISVGIPALMPDGASIYRGPWLRIPGWNRKQPVLSLSPAQVDAYARKGWVDLRPNHMAWWLGQFKKMRDSVSVRGVRSSSAWTTREVYHHETIEIGEVVAWIFSNDPEIGGYRIK